VISSFNLEALALEHVDPERTIAESLRDLMLGAADDLSEGPTPDPAGVSDPIKLPDSVSRVTAVRRLHEFGNAVSEAIDHADDLKKAEAALAVAYPGFIDSGSGVRRFGAALILGNCTRHVRLALGGGADELKPSRAYGDEAR
jgi:hypothetical protein